MRGSLSDQMNSIKATGIQWPTALELLGKYTADELDERGKNGGFRLLTDVIWRPDLVIPELPGGWIAIFAGKQEHGASGSILLMPNTPWTRKLWNIGQHKVLVEDGMTDEQAALFMVSKIRHKTRAIRHVIYLLKRHPEEAGKVILRVPKFGLADKNDFDRWCSRYLPPAVYSSERIMTILSVLKDISYPSKTHLEEAMALLAEVKPVEPEPAPEPEETAACGDAAKKKRKLSPKKREKRNNFRKKAKARRKEAKAAEAAAAAAHDVLTEAVAGAIRDKVYEKHSDATFADAAPAATQEPVDSVALEIREAMDANDAKNSHTQEA